MSLAEVLQPKEQRKLLALDGGGIRGLIAVEALAAVEEHFRKIRGNDDLRLADEFDYVAGTSTGAIIAACVSLGMSVAEMRRFYLDSGRAMFDKNSLLARFRSKFDDDRLADKLKEVIGKDTTLGSDRLRTLLLVVMRNATTDSPWPLSNNPRAMYNSPERKAQDKAVNLDLPLWQLVRASTAAPTYFPPELVDAGGPVPFLMVDGGVTMYNNPAFLVFLMATAEPYNLCWPTGTEKMMVVSIGTGTSPKANLNLAPGDMNLIYNATSIPSALMYGALNEQDLLCRIFGDCRHGAPLDREVGDLIGKRGPAEQKLFTYIRYNAELTTEWLAQHGLAHVRPKDVQALDSTDHLAELQEVGREVATQVRPDHFAGF